MQEFATTLKDMQQQLVNMDTTNNGRMVPELYMENELTITNTKVNHKDIH